MKKLLFVFSIAIGTIFYFACQKQKVIPINLRETNSSSHSARRDDVAHQLRLDIIALPADDRRAAYINLTSSQKCSVWLDKFENIYEQTWNDIQIALLNQMHSKLTEQFFTIGSGEYNDFFSSFYHQWLLQAQNHFTREELINMCIVLDDMGKDIGSRGCGCAQGDDWCWWGNSCNPDASCWTSESGCGWLMGQTCDGECN